jgi:hypothetical protein
VRELSHRKKIGPFYWCGCSKEKKASANWTTSNAPISNVVFNWTFGEFFLAGNGPTAVLRALVSIHHQTEQHLGCVEKQNKPYTAYFILFYFYEKELTLSFCRHLLLPSFCRTFFERIEEEQETSDVELGRSKRDISRVQHHGATNAAAFSGAFRA